MQGRKINHEDENISRGRRTTGTPEERRQKDLFSKEMQNYNDAVRGVRDEDDNKKRGYPYISTPNSGNRNSNYGNPFENNTLNPQRHNSDYEDSYNSQLENDYAGNSENNYQNNQSNDKPQGNPFDSNSGSPNSSYGGSQNRSNPTVFNPFAGMHAMYNSIRGVETFDPYVNEKLQKGIENVGANIRSGLIAPVRQIQGDVEESLSNGNRKSKEYQYVKSLGGLGADLVVGFSMSAQNERYMDLINKGKLDGIKVSTMENAHKILYDVRSTINPEFKFDSYADLNRLRTQIDMTSTKAGYGAISRRSPENLKRLSKTIDGDIKALNEQINNLKTGRVIPKDFTGTPLSKEQINKKIEKLTKQVEYKGATKKLINAASEISGSGKTGLKFTTNKRNIKSATKRLVLAPMTDTEVFRGYQTLHQTRMAVTTIAKAAFAQYKGMYKIARYSGRLLKRPGLFVIRKVGVVTAHAAVATLGRERLVAMANSSVVSGTKQVVNASAKVVNVGGKTVNKVARAPGIVRSSISNGKVIISDRVRYGGKVVVRGAGRLIGRTPVGKLAVKLGRTKVGRGLKFGGKIIGKTVSFPVTATKFITRQIRKIVGKIASLATSTILGIVLFGIFASFIASAAVTVITSMMMVTDAVTEKYEEFVTNTTMGATYKKLLDKENQFTTAMSTLGANAELPQEFIDQYNIHEYTDVSVEVIDGNGNAATNTQTIKSILSLAAVYIEQDFTKYGSALDGIFADSIYKDYCAKLYDSTHIISVVDPNMDGSDIYYCSQPIDDGSSDLSSNEQNYSSTRPNAAAMENCNNKSEDISVIDVSDFNTDTYIEDCRARIDADKKKYSAVVSELRGLRSENYAGRGYYSIKQAGPHGSSASVSEGSETYNETVESIEAQFRENGCTHYKWICTGLNKKSGNYRYTLVCCCPVCNGHIDAKTYVMISNIFDPSSVDAENPDLDAKNVEQKYSMYVLDKYATALNRAVTLPTTRYCTNPECEHYWNMSDGNPPEAITVTEYGQKCPSCGTVLIDEGNNRGAEKTEFDNADKADRYAFEKEVMDDLTGQNTTIVEWWNNDGWFSNLVTNKAYTRLLTGGNIEGTTGGSGTDKNVVNKSNSKMYWFDCFSAQSGRNKDFEAHGWDEDSITQARLLMSGDWKELYGISDFGGISIVPGQMGMGVGMTDEQLEQLISNNISWKDICKDRQALMYTTLKFYSEIQRLQVHYHGAGCSAPSLDALANATSDRQYFGYGAPRICPKAGYPCSTQVGIDCSGFVSWIISTTFPGQMNRRESTSSMGALVGRVLQEVQPSQLLPGDIALRPGSHVMMYIGNGQWAEAMGHKEGVRYGTVHSSNNLSKYKFYKLKFIDDSVTTDTTDPNEGFGSE